MSSGQSHPGGHRHHRRRPRRIRPHQANARISELLARTSSCVRMCPSPMTSNSLAIPPPRRSHSPCTSCSSRAAPNRATPALLLGYGAGLSYSGQVVTCRRRQVLIPEQKRPIWLLARAYVRATAISDENFHHYPLLPHNVPVSIASTPDPPYTAVIFTSIRKPTSTTATQRSFMMDELVAEQPGYLGVESARENIGITVSYWNLPRPHAPGSVA